MSERVETLREEHRRLREQAEELCEAARAIAVLDVDGREAIQEHLVGFLREQVAPHMWVDERVLYPEVTERLGDPLATASMNYDHLAIRRWIDEIARVDAHNVGQLQRLLYGLHALIVVHMWKEDELFLAALGSASWPHGSADHGRNGSGRAEDAWPYPSLAVSAAGLPEQRRASASNRAHASAPRPPAGSAPPPLGRRRDRRPVSPPRTARATRPPSAAGACAARLG